VKNPVYLSLGSNLDDRAANLEAAIHRLEQLGEITAKSSVYETEPVEMEQQPWFLNCVIALETELTPEEFLTRILAIEQSLGRRRIQPKGPRLIDIDILFFGSSIVNTATLTIPHPALHQRRFVLEPLVEIVPEFRHPVSKKTVRELLQALPEGDAVRKVSPKLIYDPWSG
jgi:2-amino-4-hydroxy-6-hydroxymethyldihydropteridine diphosphokinase